MNATMMLPITPTFVPYTITPEDRTGDKSADRPDDNVAHNAVHSPAHELARQPTSRQTNHYAAERALSTCRCHLRDSTSGRSSCR